MFICSTLFGVPTAGRTGAGGVVAVEMLIPLPAPWKVVEPERRSITVGTVWQTILEVVDDDRRVDDDRLQAERPVVGAEVDVGTVADDGDDDVDQLAVATSCCRVGSSTPLPPVKKELSSKKSSSGIDTSCQPGTGVSARAGCRDDAVELELVVVAWVRRAVGVVVLLKVDLERVVLARIGVDPEVEELCAGQIDRIGPPEATIETRRPTGSPPRLEREVTTQRGRKIGVVGGDAAAPDSTVE